MARRPAGREERRIHLELNSEAPEDPAVVLSSERSADLDPRFLGHVSSRRAVAETVAARGPHACLVAHGAMSHSVLHSPRRRR